MGGGPLWWELGARAVREEAWRPLFSGSTQISGSTSWRIICFLGGFLALKRDCPNKFWVTLCPPSPQDLPGMGDGSQLHIGRRDR